MGTLFNELQKWLKSPAPLKSQHQKIQQWQKEITKAVQQSKGPVDVPKVAKAVLSAKSTTREVVPRAYDLAENNELIAIPYLVGQYALDVATMAKIEVQSLAYPTGKSPSLLPWALRFSPEQAYIDLGRLSLWDQWKILWTRIGAHYYQDTSDLPFIFGENE